jgi:hypothetical protein
VRFEDLYFFFLQLFLLWDLVCSLVCWLYLLASSFDGRTVGLSYTQLGVGLLWLEHVCYAVVSVCFTLGVATLRILTRTPGELGFWWF